MESLLTPAQIFLQAEVRNFASGLPTYRQEGGTADPEPGSIAAEIEARFGVRSLETLERLLILEEISRVRADLGSILAERWVASGNRGTLLRTAVSLGQAVRNLEILLAAAGDSSPQPGQVTPDARKLEGAEGIAALESARFLVYRAAAFGLRPNPESENVVERDAAAHDAAAGLAGRIARLMEP